MCGIPGPGPPSAWQGLHMAPELSLAVIKVHLLQPQGPFLLHLLALAGDWGREGGGGAEGHY